MSRLALYSNLMFEAICCPNARARELHPRIYEDDLHLHFTFYDFDYIYYPQISKWFYFFGCWITSECCWRMKNGTLYKISRYTTYNYQLFIIIIIIINCFDSLAKICWYCRIPTSMVGGYTLSSSTWMSNYITIGSFPELKLGAN